MTPEQARIFGGTMTLEENRVTRSEVLSVKNAQRRKVARSAGKCVLCLKRKAAPDCTRCERCKKQQAEYKARVKATR